MSKAYELFIDELGQANPISKQSKIYVLLGCAIEERQRSKLKIWADQIKFKYWGRTNIIFHSREIARNKGVFSTLEKSRSIKQNFHQDLFNFLKQSSFVVFVITCNNQLAKQLGWNSIKVVKETGKWIFYHFITWLLGNNSKGKINIESATAEKDRYYLNTFSYFLSPKNKELSVDYKKVQDLLTSISFVTKRNHDIEEQVADLLAYAAKCKYLRLTKKQAFKLGSYEDIMIKILDTKLWHLPKLAGERKMKFYKSIEPFCIIPKKSKKTSSSRNRSLPRFL